MKDKRYFPDDREERILDLFLEVTQGKLDSNNVIHIGKQYGKNKTDKIRPLNVIDFANKLLESATEGGS